MTKVEMSIAQVDDGYQLSVRTAETKEATVGEKNLAHLFAATLDFLSVRLKTRMEAADKELKAREAKDGRPQ